MTWKCPACQTSIKQDEASGHRGAVYRCHTCRLELVQDPHTGELTLAPLPTPDDQTRSR
jgi:predicted Zn finger-like uncharacterized protein